MKPIAEIRAALTARQVAEGYGFKANRAGFIQCPFHSGDKNGSLVVHHDSPRWHCFGCNEGGDVIDFVRKLYGLSLNDACDKLNQDFALGFSESKFDRRAYSEVMARRKKEQEEKDRKEQLWWSACRSFRMYRTILETRCPMLVAGEPPQELDPLFAEALHWGPFLEEWLNTQIERGNYS